MPHNNNRRYKWRVSKQYTPGVTHQNSTKLTAVYGNGDTRELMLMSVAGAEITSKWTISNEYAN